MAQDTKPKYETINVYALHEIRTRVTTYSHEIMGRWYANHCTSNAGMF